MSIIDREIADITKHGNRRRVRFKYTLGDGRFIVSPSFNVADPTEANTKMTSFESIAYATLVRQDAQEAQSRGIKVAYKEATADQVKQAWSAQGMSEREPHRSYNILKEVFASLTGRAEVHWDKLLVDEAVILNYQAILSRYI